MRAQPAFRGARSSRNLNIRSVASGLAATFPNPISVNSRTATPSDSSNNCAFLSASYPPYQRACACAGRGGQLIAMLGPEASPVLVAISYATVMSVVGVAVPVPEIPAGFGGGRHGQ